MAIESVRVRYLADRIMLILLYSAPTDGMLERTADGAVLIKAGPLARALKLNSTRLYDQLLFLQHSGYLTDVDPKARWGWVSVKPTRPAVNWTT